MTADAPDAPSTPARLTGGALRSLLVLLAMLLAGRFGLELAGPSAFISAFWPSAGLALAVLVRLGQAQLPALVLGAAMVNVWAGAPWWLALLMAMGNTGGPWLAARWLQRNGFNPRLEQRRDLALLVLAGVFGSAVVSSANGTAWLAATGRLPMLELPRAALTWWAGDALGLLVAGVPLLTASRRSFAVPLAPGRRAGTLTLVLASLGLGAAALFMPHRLAPVGSVLLLAPPVLLCWLAMRNGLGPASAALLLLALGFLGGTGAGLGPFALLPPVQAQLVIWVVLAAMAALVLLPHVQLGELARLEERWQLALDGSDLGVADWNLRTGASFSSPRWRALMADPDGGQTATLERWLSQVHAEDRDALKSALAAVDTPAGAGLRREARVRVRDGWCWFDVHVIVAERDAAGEPLRVIASLADIGARRSAEEREHLSSNVFMHLHEGLVVCDADLRVLDANPTYHRITGIPREELIGTVPSLLRPGAADVLNRPQQASLWSALRSHGHWVGEVVERRRNGEPCALHVTVSSVHAPDGALRYHVMVVTDVTEQRLQRERLERQAHFDELTRLPNRARLTQLLGEAMAATERDGYLLVVCYLDVDHFKAINERHGHEAGDLLLAELAKRMRSALRARGTTWSDTAARLGGDEFVLLLRASTVDEARAAVERVLRLVAQPMVLASGALPEAVTASVGATIYPLDASDADTLLRHADHAMYGVKQSGRNGYLFFDPEHSRRAEERATAIGRVQEALDRGELVLYYQPKVDLRRGVVLGAEALLRWNHPERGVVPPAQFLPLIERTGLSARVGDWVLAQALDQVEVWQRQGLDLSVSVNISARHLQEPDFAQRLSELLARHERPLGPKLELEVLESEALGDINLTSSLLARCATLGVRWALDDFGTAYSTFTNLKRLPVQVLKIDRSFVQHMLADAQDRAIVEGVIALARAFECVVVAEGVETPAQARMLLDMGCDVGQGAGIAYPMPAAEVAPWVREWRGLFALSATPTPPAPSPTAASPALPGTGTDATDPGPPSSAGAE
ncbi:EAL domain-containing protein [Ideonella sp. DXS22W]|uniref:EAL domain-containing protein n=1 Tax=Pseudaquabacterium inlustre TaxID=2984192 RepID=A0ABU9CFY4_9BURK